MHNMGNQEHVLRSAVTARQDCEAELQKRGGGLGSSTIREVGGWGRVPFSRNLMSPTPRRNWYLTTGRRAH